MFGWIGTTTSFRASAALKWSSFPRFISVRSFSNGRKFRVLGVQQIAVGGTDKQALSKLWQDTLGVPKVGEFQSEKENVDEDILKLSSSEDDPHAVEIDLMQPLDEAKSPKVHVPPLNHIGLWIDNLAEAYKELEGKGVRFTPGGIRKGASGHDVCFIHPKGNDKFPLSGCGVLIELVQAPENVVKAKTPLK